MIKMVINYLHHLQNIIDNYTFDFLMKINKTITKTFPSKYIQNQNKNIFIIHKINYKIII